MEHKIKRALEEVLNPLEYGCKITIDGETGNVYVYDLYKWTDEHMNLLLFLCPGVRMTVQGSCQSLSGFFLIFGADQKRRTSHYAMRFGFLCLGILWAIYAAFY